MWCLVLLSTAAVHLKHAWYEPLPLVGTTAGHVNLQLGAATGTPLCQAFAE